KTRRWNNAPAIAVERRDDLPSRRVDEQRRVESVAIVQQRVDGTRVAHGGFQGRKRGVIVVIDTYDEREHRSYDARADCWVAWLHSVRMSRGWLNCERVLCLLFSIDQREVQR